MSEEMNFGSYIRAKRENQGKTLRGLAAELEIAPAYLCDIERGNRNPPENYFDKIINLFNLSGDELNKFYDLVGEYQKGSPPDLNEYIYKNGIVREALRRARDNNITEQQWQEFIDMIGF